MFLISNITSPQHLTRLCACSNSILLLARLVMKSFQKHSQIQELTLSSLKHLVYSQAVNWAVIAKSQLQNCSSILQNTYLRFRSYDAAQVQSMAAQTFSSNGFKLQETILKLYNQKLAQNDYEFANQIASCFKNHRFFYGLQSLEVFRALILSFVIFYTMCRSDFELSSQMLQFRKLKDRKQQQIQKLQENLHRVYFCQISNSFKEIIKNTQEQTTFTIQLLLLTILQGGLQFLLQTHYEVEIDLSYHSFILNAFLLLVNGNDIFLPLINCFTGISIDYFMYLIKSWDASNLENDINETTHQVLTEPRQIELLFQVISAFTIISIFSIQMKEKFVVEQIEQNQLMIKNINRTLHQKEKRLVVQFTLAKSESEVPDGIGLSALKNITYQRIKMLQGQHISQESIMRNFQDQISVQVLSYDRCYFENKIQFSCYGGFHDINYGKNEISFREFMSTFNKYRIDRDHAQSFLYQNVRVCLTKQFPCFQDIESNDIPQKVIMGNNFESQTQFQLQNEDEIKFDFDRQLKILTVVFEPHQKTAETAFIGQICQDSKSKDDQKSILDAKTISVENSSFINVEQKQKEQKMSKKGDNDFLKQLQDNYREFEKDQSYGSIVRKGKKKQNKTVFVVEGDKSEEIEKVHTEEESFQVSQKDLEVQDKRERNTMEKSADSVDFSNLNQSEDNTKIKPFKLSTYGRTSTNEMINMFEVGEKKDIDGKNQSSQKSATNPITFSDGTKISSFEMKKNIFRLGGAYNEQISSIQNSERIKKRRDSSNPSTTIECVADQRIKELDSSSFLISTGRDKNDGSIREEMPKYDSSLHQEEANQSLVQLNQEIENEDIAVQEILHDQMMKIQGQLKNNRIFMDMVIHDMRNPTLAIQYHIQEIFEMLQNEQNKTKWIKQQRNINLIKFKSSSSLLNMMSSSMSVSSVLINSNKSLIECNLIRNNSSNDREKSNQGESHTSKSHSGSEIEEEKDCTSMIMKRALINMNYSNPSQDFSSRSPKTGRKSAAQRFVQNGESYSAIDNSAMIQQFSISSNKLSQLNQLNTEKKPNLLEFSDQNANSRHKFGFPSSQYPSKTESQSFVYTANMIEVYLLIKGPSLLFLKMQKQIAQLSRMKRIKRPPSQTEVIIVRRSILNKAVSKSLSNEYNERNIFKFIDEANGNILNNYSSSSSSDLNQIEQESLESEEDEQIPMNQNRDIVRSLSYSMDVKQRSNDPQIPKFSVMAPESNQSPQALGHFLIQQPLFQQNSDVEEDFDDQDVDEMPGSSIVANISESSPYVFNNPINFMKTKNNQIQQIEHNQIDNMMKSISSKLSSQLNQIDRNLALQNDQQQQSPVLKYWNGGYENENQIQSNSPLADLQRDFSELKKTLDKYQSAMETKSKEMSIAQTQQIVYQKPFVQTAPKATQVENNAYQAHQRSSLIQHRQVIQSAQEQNLQQNVAEVAASRGSSILMNGRNSQLSDQNESSEFNLDSERQIFRASEQNVNQKPLLQQQNEDLNQIFQKKQEMKEQSTQCSMISKDILSQLTSQKVQNQINSAKMNVLIGQQTFIQKQNQEFQQKMYSDQQMLKEQQNIIEMYDSELKAIDKQENQNKNFQANLIKFLQNTVYQSKMLNNLINDMLDLAKFESGTFKFHNDYFDLTDIVQQAFQTLRHQATKKGIRLDFKIKDERIKLDETMQNVTIQDQPLYINTLENRSIDSNQAMAQSNYSCLDFNPSGTSYASKAEVRNESDNHTIQSQIMQSRSTSKDIRKYFTDIYGDKNRYLQILLNIIGNSINYTKQGEVTVTFILLEEQNIKPKQYAKSLQQSEKQGKQNRTSTNNRGQDNQGSNQSLSRARVEEINQIAHAQSQTNGVPMRSTENQNTLQTSAPAVQAFHIIKPNRQKSDIIRESQPNENLIRQVNEQNEVPNNLDSPTGSQHQNIRSQEHNSIDDSIAACATNVRQTRYHGTEDLQQSMREGFSHCSSQNSKFITFRIEVKDTGVGIKKEDISKLFTDFTRLDKNMNNKGTGLGLSICKQMIEKMGGNVDVQSVFGQGSTFRVTLSTKTNTQPKQYNSTGSNNDNSDRQNDIERSLINNLSSQGQTQNFTSSNTNQYDSMKMQSSSHARISNVRNDLERLQHQSMQIDKTSEDEIIKRGLSSFTLSSAPGNYNNFGSMESSLSNQMLVSGQRSINSGRQSDANGSDSRLIPSNSGSYHSQITVMKIQEVQKQQQIQRAPQQEIIIQRAQPLAAIHEEFESSSFILPNQHEESKEHHQQPSSMFLDPINSSKESSDEYIPQSSSLIDSKSVSFASNANMVTPKNNNLFHQNPMAQSSVDSFQLQYREPSFGTELSKDQSNIIGPNEVDFIIQKEPSRSQVVTSEYQFKCLVANDTEFLLMANTQVLEKCNVEVTGVINGLEAYEMVTIAERWFDFIILDLQMPIMDGLTAATKINTHFNDKNRLFPDLDSFGNHKNDNTNVKDRLKMYLKSAQLRRQSIVKNSLEESKGITIDEMMVVKPFMVACSSVMSENIKQQCKEVGFDLCLQQPLSVLMVKNQILDILKKQKSQSQSQIVQK